MARGPAYTQEMEYRRLGKTGLKVSSLCLGTMTFGSKFYNIGKLDVEAAKGFLKIATESGINFFDTANVYSFGESEEILGRAIKEINFPRTQAVIATKVMAPMSEAAAKRQGDINNRGLSRKHIFESCDASLRRLGTDYIDLYQVHGWDPTTPIEETLGALDDVVRAGKVRYLGASNWTARHLAKALRMAAFPFVSLQAYYSLVGRDLEHELAPLCVEEGLGILPWSPLAGGLLSGKYRKGDSGRRSNFDFPPVESAVGDAALDALQSLSQEKGASMAQLANAWLLHQPGVSSVIIGASREDQLHDNLKAAEIRFTPEELAKLSSATAPKKLYPGWMLDFQNRTWD
jgi:aryl-alcohol dehydrogenase-like predicted oxidoreductase